MPAGVAAALMIVVGECAFLATTPPMTGQPLLEPTADDAVIQAKLDLMPRAAGAVALVGDSSCFMGLDPRELGTPAVNLGTLSSLTMAGYAAMTAELLRRPEPPRAVVVAVLPRALEVNEMRARDYQALGRTLAATGWRSPHFPVGMSDHTGLFARKHQWNTFPPEFGGSYRAFAAKLAETGGYRAETKSRIEIPWVRDEFTPEPFAVDNFRRLVRDCHSRGVPLVLWWSPSPDAAETQRYRDGVRDWAEEFAASEPRLIVPQPSPPGWPARLFATESHVNQQGTFRNSHELAESLRTRLMPP